MLDMEFVTLADLFDGIAERHSADYVERCCEVMHDAYERAAVGAGWETQQASRKPWADVPEANKATMRAAVVALLDHIDVRAALAVADALGINS
jgi:hypothetical protein